MTINVQTSIDVTADVAVQHVAAFATVDLRSGKPPRALIEGLVAVGDDDTPRPLTLNGSAHQLRRLAKAIEDGAMEMERLHADAHAAWDRRQHYEAAEAAAQSEAVQV